MAGLYGDLPDAIKTGSEATKWGAMPNLQPQARPKQEAPKPKPAAPVLAPPPALLRAGRGGGRTPGAGGRGGGRVISSSIAADGADAGQGAAAAGTGPVQQSSISIFASVKDEYDPLKPNDYEELLRERERAKREAEAEVERVARVREMEATMERLRQQEEGPGARPGAVSGAIPPPPALNVSGEEAWARRGQLGGSTPSGGLGTPGAGLGSTPGLGAEPGSGGGAAGAAGAVGAGAGAGEGGGKGMSLAQKLLMKMGWREGEGLGRERQGISTPLVMQKTNARAGVVVQAEALGGGDPAAKRPRQGAVLVGVPSRVLCLRNMVGPGEVDEELEEEVGMECTKYGTVTSVMIFEVTAAGFPDEEAVRIFVQFERVESATKAQVDLQGRFFGGRNVRVAFFPEERFEKTDIAPRAGEFD